MAHDRRVVRKPDIPRIVLVVFAARRVGHIVDNECALHIDAHSARMEDSFVDVRLHRRATRASGPDDVSAAGVAPVVLPASPVVGSSCVLDGDMDAVLGLGCSLALLRCRLLLRSRRRRTRCAFADRLDVECRGWVREDAASDSAEVNPSICPLCDWPLRPGET
jgi:hypothetical protein